MTVAVAGIPGVSELWIAGMSTHCPRTNKGVVMREPHSDQKGESDVESDAHVAGSRAGRKNNGDYVGRTSADDDFDSGETGAEARSSGT